MSRLDSFERSNRIWVLIGSVVSLAVAVVLISSLMSAKRSDSGEVIGEIKMDSITCESDKVAYPFFEYDDSVSKLLKVTAMSDGDNLHSVSLQYILYYNDEESILRSEGGNHAAMNMGFYERGLGSDAINATYSRLSNGLRFGLYQTGGDLSETEKEYFFLDGLMKYDVDTLSALYNGMGMNCKITK